MINKVMNKMIRLYQGDPGRIQHFLKVYTFGKLIGEEEGLDPNTQETLEIAALVHDIGIHRAAELYGSTSGKYQELEGPILAQELLTECGLEKEKIDRVCFLVAHHHTYDQVDGLDYRILLEADFLVNAYEDSLPKETIQNGLDHIFRTLVGKRICKEMFDL